MKLIKLESDTGTPIWINPEWVMGLLQIDAGIRIVTGEGNAACWIVTGTLDEVAAILMEENNA